MATTSLAERRRPTWKTIIKDIITQGWETRWTAYLESIPPDYPKTPSQLAITPNTLQLHEGVSKAMSSLITQIRTEKIGLNAFLFDRRVPDILPTCACGWPRQTAKHIIKYCPNWEDRRGPLQQLESWDNYQLLLGIPRNARIVAKWMHETNLLPQFSLDIE